MARAKEELDQELVEKEEEKERYLAENVPPPRTSGLSLAELQVIFLHLFVAAAASQRLRLKCCM